MFVSLIFCIHLTIKRFLYEIFNSLAQFYDKSQPGLKTITRCMHMNRHVFPVRQVIFVAIEMSIQPKIVKYVYLYTRSPPNKTEIYFRKLDD